MQRSDIINGTNNQSTTYMRCAFYGRYSTQMQRPASIEDQRRVCDEFAQQKGWEILHEHVYTDAAMSGTSKVGRKGLESLEAAAGQKPRPFDYILFDDSSRLARDLGDVLQFHKLVEHHGVKLLFVSQRLDSADPNFQMLISMHGMIDEQQIQRLRHKVHAAQKGRVLAGYVAGSWPYGYRAVVDEDLEFPGAIGRAATKGTRLEVVEDQASVVRRIFELYAEGNTIWNIAVRLNQEGVPRNSQFRSRGNGKGWPGDAIKKILHNEKYKGVFVWNQKRQQVHPRTGKITVVKRPAHEHVRVDMPHLRIVPDELWHRAAARLKELERKQEARRLGGYNRAKNKPYLYSGLLCCGLCGRRLYADGPAKTSAYTCPSFRLRRGCSNSYRILQERAAAQITEVLSSSLLEEPLWNQVVKSVHSELEMEWNAHRSSLAGDNLSALEANRRDCQRRMDSLLDQIEELSVGDPSREALSGRLRHRQSERDRLDIRIAAARNLRSLDVTETDLRQLVRDRIANLLSVLQSDAAFAKKVLQQHIRRIVLFPGTDETGEPYFEAVAEIDMFAGKDDTKPAVMLGLLGTQKPQHHTVDTSLGIVFRLYPYAFACPHLPYLVHLLESKHELASRPLSPTLWAALINSVLPVDQPKVGYGAVARCFWAHLDQLDTRLTVTKIPNRSDPGHRYQLSLKSTPAAESHVGDELNVPAEQPASTEASACELP